MLVSAVTGDVGAGKSTLTALWRSAGASVIDADEIVRMLWKRPEIISEASSRWGSGILDVGGEVVPSRVASRAFGDKTEYRWLCDLLHPLVRVEMERMVTSLEGWVVAEIPLLFESAPPWWVDVSVYVTVPEDLRRVRNSIRGWSDGEIARRESFLLPSEEKKRHATLVLENSGTLEEFRSLAAAQADIFLRTSSLVRCSVLFQKLEEARRYAEHLRKERLGTECVCAQTVCPETLQRGESFDRSAPSVLAGNEKAWLITFVTLDRWFSLLSLPHCMDAAKGPYLERIRRMPWTRRIALSKELRP